MKKKLIKTNRDIRIEPEKEAKYLLLFWGTLLFLIIIAETLSTDHAEYIRLQSRFSLLLLVLFISRLITINDWGEHYKESINLLFMNQKIDSYVIVSVLNVLFDFFILFCLFVWVETEKVSFARIPISGLIYVLMIGFSVLKHKFSTLKRKRVKR